MQGFLLEVEVSKIKVHEAGELNAVDDHPIRHPALVPYESLKEDDREKDRNAVRVLLIVLGQQGRVVIRPSAK